MAPTAAAQVPPRIVFALDTSGSMTYDLDGRPTFGDGVTEGCTAGPGGALCGANCTAGFDSDCDGELNDSRMYIAKEAMRQIVLAYGEVDWALARFHQLHGIDAECAELAANEYECGPLFIGALGNPQCHSGSVIPNALSCANDIPAQYPESCRPGSNGNADMRVWVSADDPVCINYEGGTECAGDILVGYDDMGAFTGRSSTDALLRWMDGRETAFSMSRTTGNFCDHAGSGDCELRPSGLTPIAELLRDVRLYSVPVRDADTQSACRRYSVILLTDGLQSSERCGGDPEAEAAALHAEGFDVYVIGLGLADFEQQSLNDIAAAGGTGSAFFPADLGELSAHMSQVVSDSLIFESCDGTDEDCDGEIDEGVKNACGGCGELTETCDGVDEDCDGTVDEGATNACGGCGPVPAETCNGVDDDCDGPIDEAPANCGGCVVGPESCDGVDNDCDGSVDEDLTRSCGTDVGECTSGTQTCTDGTFGPCSGRGPEPESCNGEDDDCDGVVDGMVQPCGTDEGICRAGTERCVNGTFGACEGSVGPAAGGESCDGRDEDCDGTVDEANPGGGGACGSTLGTCEAGVVQCMSGRLVCTGGVGPEPELCDDRDNDCDGAVDEDVPDMGACGETTGVCEAGLLACRGGTFTCVGARGPSAEVCDGRDDDCDGMVDNGDPGAGEPCGSSTGECTMGTTVCSGGSIVCSGARAPSAELCNVADDDCDGRVDEGNPEGGVACGDSDVGACERGSLECAMGSLVCVGEVTPSEETCNGVDDDCDTRIDEGDLGSGAPCGSSTGACEEGVRSCVAGELVCEGEVLPTEETCNGVDDDCDGFVDDGLAVGGPCGTDVGECVQGVELCSEGEIVCAGATDPAPEVCDGLDNDCDGESDEGLGLGGACGSDVGICMEGAELCSDGELLCDGEVTPRREGCNCEDDDCDASIDEVAEGGDLCPGDAECVECQCALPCREGEFGFTCPTGRSPVVQDDERCFCVAELCDPDACAEQTISRDGLVLCAPDAADVAHCVCRNNECTFACEGVTCSPGTRCDPRLATGACVEDSCRGLGCSEGDLCNRTTGECEANLCHDVSCEPEQACFDGECIGSCAGVECPQGQSCTRGECVPDPCTEVSCPPAQVCDPEDGECVDNRCSGTVCPGGQICEPTTGECVDDPCERLVCPSGQRCVDGQCEGRFVPPDAGPPDAGAVDGGARDDVLAAGGCMCRVGASGAGADRGLFVGLLPLLILAMRRRRGGAK